MKNKRSHRVIFSEEELVSILFEIAKQREFLGPLPMHRVSVEFVTKKRTGTSAIVHMRHPEVGA
jgi:hypothetical protein